IFDSLFRVLSAWKARAWGKKTSASPAPTQEYEPIPEDYPIFPHQQKLPEDNSLYALYRLYEYFVLDEVFACRNVLEWLWRQSRWRISDIADHKDDDPSRYAFLAGTTYLIVRAFNARVKLGLSRNGRALMSVEEAEEARNKPESERQYKKAPLLAENVPALKEILVIPPLDGTILSGATDEQADPDFLAKNIVLWTPHIHFT
ncbi:hypothetical protein ACJ73_07716, partial [Blastomyces percursus]